MKKSELQKLVKEAIEEIKQENLQQEGKLGKFLGRKGLMPNPKTGTVVQPQNISQAILASKKGSTEIKIRDLLRLNEGSVVELDRLAGDPLDILANGTIIAKGEVVMVGERFGIRFTEVSDPKERVQSL